MADQNNVYALGARKALGSTLKSVTPKDGCSEPPILWGLTPTQIASCYLTPEETPARQPLKLVK